ncbi:FlhC family transcriptional regulator [Pseudoduganella rivuli]|nr:FlhC family transcriptional regulator [Pseudoduganella rivuli]
MSIGYVERHIRALILAKQCVEFGARVRTISFITGMSHADLNELFYAGEFRRRRGRAPDATDWLHRRANIIVRAEASVFASVFEKIFKAGFDPAETMVGAYRIYTGLCAQSPRISFDRAFDLACHLKGWWAHKQPSFALYPCPACNSLYVAALGDQTTGRIGCIFCNLVSRYEREKRLQNVFQVDGTPPD